LIYKCYVNVYNIQSYKSLTGPKGVQGPTGPQGLTGPAGPQGLTGPTGPASVIDFADFYALMPGDNTETIAQNAAIQFPQSGPINGSSITRLSVSTFELIQGVYQITFQASITEAGQLAIYIDGTLIIDDGCDRAKLNAPGILHIDCAAKWSQERPSQALPG
jgi:hypothetical protein